MPKCHVTKLVSQNASLCHTLLTKFAFFVINRMEKCTFVSYFSKGYAKAMLRGGRLGEITGRKWEIINIPKGSPPE
jgi:hypothetical protein